MPPKKKKAAPKKNTSARKKAAAPARAVGRSSNQHAGGHDGDNDDDASIEFDFGVPSTSPIAPPAAVRIDAAPKRREESGGRSATPPLLRPETASRSPARPARIASPSAGILSAAMRAGAPVSTPAADLRTNIRDVAADMTFGEALAAKPSAHRPASRGSASGRSPGRPSVSPAASGKARSKKPSRLDAVMQSSQLQSSQQTHLMVLTPPPQPQDQPSSSRPQLAAPEAMPEMPAPSPKPKKSAANRGRQQKRGRDESPADSESRSTSTATKIHHDDDADDDAAVNGDDALLESIVAARRAQAAGRPSRPSTSPSRGKTKSKGGAAAVPTAAAAVQSNRKTASSSAKQSSAKAEKTAVGNTHVETAAAPQERYRRSPAMARSTDAISDTIAAITARAAAGDALAHNRAIQEALRLGGNASLTCRTAAPGLAAAASPVDTAPTPMEPIPTSRHDRRRQKTALREKRSSEIEQWIDELQPPGIEPDDHHHDAAHHHVDQHTPPVMPDTFNVRHNNEGIEKNDVDAAAKAPLEESKVTPHHNPLEPGVSTANDADVGPDAGVQNDGADACKVEDEDEDEDARAPSEADKPTPAGAEELVPEEDHEQQEAESTSNQTVENAEGGGEDEGGDDDEPPPDEPMVASDVADVEPAKSNAGGEDEDGCAPPEFNKPAPTDAEVDESESPAQPSVPREEQPSLTPAAAAAAAAAPRSLAAMLALVRNTTARTQQRRMRDEAATQEEATQEQDAPQPDSPAKVSDAEGQGKKIIGVPRNVRNPLTGGPLPGSLSELLAQVEDSTTGRSRPGLLAPSSQTTRTTAWAAQPRPLDADAQTPQLPPRPQQQRQHQQLPANYFDFDATPPLPARRPAPAPTAAPVLPGRVFDGLTLRHVDPNAPDLPPPPRHLISAPSSQQRPSNEMEVMAGAATPPCKVTEVVASAGAVWTSAGEENVMGSRVESGGPMVRAETAPGTSTVAAAHVKQSGNAGGSSSVLSPVKEADHDQEDDGPASGTMMMGLSQPSEELIGAMSIRTKGNKATKKAAADVVKVARNIGTIGAQALSFDSPESKLAAVLPAHTKKPTAKARAALGSWVPEDEDAALHRDEGSGSAGKKKNSVEAQLYCCTYSKLTPALKKFIDAVHGEELGMRERFNNDCCCVFTLTKDTKSKKFSVISGVCVAEEIVKAARMSLPTPFAAAAALRSDVKNTQGAQEEKVPTSTPPPASDETEVLPDTSGTAKPTTNKAGRGKRAAHKSRNTKRGREDVDGAEEINKVNGADDAAATAAADVAQNATENGGEQQLQQGTQLHSLSKADLAEWAATATAINTTVIAGGSMCGVRLIWVSEESRGCGLATAMVDAARLAVVYGYEVERGLCAFSTPTADGRLFAAKFTGRLDFLTFV